jgi:ribonuclease HII
MPNFTRERRIEGPVAGIDEAGRGPLAGPVYAAAVILDPARLPRGVNDSKALSAEEREKLFEKIMERALSVGVGFASVREIDEINILQATMLAMRRATEALSLKPVRAIIDGNRAPKDLPCPADTLIDGDAKSMSIAAASIIAKVTRDRVMCGLDLQHPGYNWSQNKGYATADHRAALDALGPSPQHRVSFGPVALAKLPLNMDD